MTSQAVARRYAHALFDVARRAGDPARPERDLRAFRDLVTGHPELAGLFSDPLLPPQKKIDLVKAVLAAGGPVDADVSRLLLMLAERDRLALLNDVVNAY